MNQSGITPEGKKVISGVFKMVGTHGLPLEIILSEFQQKNWVVDWMDYIKDALRDGAKLNNVKSRIGAAVGDVYGHIYRQEIENRLNKIQ